VESRYYEKILDGMPEIGIYVIGEKDHEILYYNKRMQEASPEMHLEMICHEAWNGSCDNCPLLTIEDRQESHSISYNAPFGGVVDLVATRVFWEENIPAFVITVTPRIEVAGYAYRKIMRVDLSNGSYRVLKADLKEWSMEGENISEKLEAFARGGAVHPDDVERFAAFIQLENLQNVLKSRKKILTCIYRRRLEGGFRWNLLEFMLDFDHTVGFPTALLCVKDVHDVLREGLEHEEINLRNQEIIRTLGEKIFNIYTIDMNTGVVRPIRVDGHMQDGLSFQILLWYTVCAHIKKRLHPAYQEEFERRFSMEGLCQSQKDGEKKTEMICQWESDEGYRYIEVTASFSQKHEEKSYTVFALRDVDEHMRQELADTQRDKNNLQILQDRAYIISSLSSLFFSTYYVDLEHNTFRTVTQLSRVGDVLGSEVDCSEALRIYAENFIYPDDREEYLKVMNVQNWLQTLRWWQPFVALEYRKLPDAPLKDPKAYSWVRATAVVAQIGMDDIPKTVVYVAQDISESKKVADS
jgi:hypothetical protein